MSEPWIKMRTNLDTNPKVVRISVELRAHVGAVCGACYLLWSIADRHSISGRLEGYTYEVIDTMVGLAGFCKAAENVEWVALSAGIVTLPGFGKHNGNTAKSRALTARRASRSRHARVTVSALRKRDGTVTKSAPRLDEMRLDKTSAAAGAAADVADGAAAAAGVLSDEVIKARQEYLRKRPEWLPDSRPWLSADVVAELAAMPALDQDAVDRVYREARDSRLTLKNPAGLIVKKLREAGRGG